MKFQHVPIFSLFGLFQEQVLAEENRILPITAALDTGKGRTLQDRWTMDEEHDGEEGMSGGFEGGEPREWDDVQGVQGLNVDRDEDGWDSWEDSEGSSAMSTLVIVGITAAACVVLDGVLVLVNKRKSNGRSAWRSSHTALATTPRGNSYTL